MKISKIPYIHILIGIFLFMLGISLSLIYFLNSDFNLNILSSNEKIRNIRIKHNLMTGEFTSSNNYLGILVIRFINTSPSYGQITVRIKENHQDWYHTATIEELQYNGISEYEFGIPVITDSKGRTYQFEIKSPSLYSIEPVMISKYVYPRKLLFSNAVILIDFVIKKELYFIKDFSSLPVFIVYELPLIGYILFLLFFRHLIPKKTENHLADLFKPIFKPLTIIAILGMLVNVFIIRQYSGIIDVILICFWIFGIITYKLEPRHSFLIALMFLIFCPFLLSANMIWVAEKSAILLTKLLVVGIIHTIYSKFKQ